VKPIARRLLPGFAVLLGASVVARTSGLSDVFAALLPGLPWVVLGGGILLGWVFHRSRLVLALGALTLTHWALVSFVSVTGPGRTVLATVALLLPLDLAVLLLLPERNPLGRRGRWDLGMLLVQVPFVAWISRPAMAPLAAATQYRFLDVPLSLLTAVPQPALLMFAAAFVALMIRLVRHPGAVEAGLLWALAGGFLALGHGRPGVEPAIYLTAGALALVMAVIEASRQLAYGDELTGLPSRRALNETLGGLRGRYTIAMADIDHFKSFNDRHGHEAGDQLLRKVGTTLAGVGGGGRAFRYGGEEFAVVFAGDSVAEALPHLEALRRAIETSGFVVRSEPARRRGDQPRRRGAGGAGRVSVTVSMGAAETGPRHTSADDVLQAADAALYRAKRAGRNRIVV
jgi:diguanylate cyclase (GGDEF)-like protein